ncbi:Hypothetical predicted protein [Lecanosticta acicola]|uniref:Uncharacterized protein n=1 Tax=Lecanosticta acicola TaxID=111012 RepID=A0AAI8YY82_9PEZI|nr:Hypothetical predicted protein [Lecanosticta acicola]
MAIFSRKSSAAKAASKQEKTEPTDTRPKTETKAIASHARSASVGPRNGGTQNAKQISQYRTNRSEIFTEPSILPVPEPHYMSHQGLTPPTGYQREHSYATPHYADSGYDSGSAINSRAPSEKYFPEDYRYYNHQTSAPYIPELGLGEGILANDGNVSPVDADEEAKSVTSSASAHKKTRGPPEPMPSLGLLRSHQRVSQSRSARRYSLPPLSMLDGLKVNKRGRILDEEGEPIGELVEGDLLDCVRQRANASGEVLDEYGRVVGVVRTIPNVSQASEALLPGVSSPVEQEQYTPERSRSTGQELNRPALSLQTRTAPTSASLKMVAQPLRHAQPQALHPAHRQEEETQIAAPVSPVVAVEREAPSLVLPTPHEPITPIIQLCEPEAEPQSESANLMGRTKARRDAETQEEKREETQPQAPPRQEVQVPSASIEAASKDFAGPSESPKRPARSASERSLSELGKTYARPAMSSVPEDNIAEDVIMPAEGHAFAFRGEIPVDDRPQREARSRSPNVAINPKAALALGQPHSALITQNPRMSMKARRATTQVTGSHESSPGRSDSGGRERVSEDGGQFRPGHFRSTSFQSAGTSMPTKPRTYFTHGGKITMDANAVPVTPAAAEAAPKPAVVEDQKVEKKKSRMSLGFGRKTAAK